MPHPVRQLLEWFPDCDFAVLEHGWAPHGRDYELVVEHSGYTRPGRHRFTFTHVVELAFETRVRDDVWPGSWDDVFTDYAAWQAAGEPPGYVWGVNWSMAYPGLEAVEPSDRAGAWALRVGQDIHEVRLETNQFLMTCCFHALRTEHLDARTDLVSQVIIPLDG